MPLSTVCTVSSRPRIWSSYTNIRAKDVPPPIMNSTEEISKYKENSNHYYSPTLSRRLLGYGYELPEKVQKKDKKWSLGSLFRRKKKEESDSSSEDDTTKRGFLRRRKKEKKKKQPKTSGVFDHVVLSRNPHFFTNGFEDPGIFSDPLPKKLETRPKIQHSLDDVTVTSSRSSLIAPSSDGAQRKGKKILSKVRAEARRLNLKLDTSSEDDSHCSTSSAKFRSDESLNPNRDSLVHKKSRAARTERYLKRHSRDGEVSKDFLKLSKSDADDRSLSRSPLTAKPQNSYSSLSGLSTIPPSHGVQNRIRVSNSTSNPSYKPPLSMNEYNLSIKKPTDFPDQRSISYDADIHKPEVLHVQFPLRQPRRLTTFEKQPPPPPPRDPKRLVTAQYYENARPNTFYLDQMRSKSFNTPSPPKPKFTSFNGRSTSEDYLPKNGVQLLPRPSSATPDAKLGQKPDSYNYLTDKKPRSRKPIFIQKSGQKVLDFWKGKEKEKPQMFTCQTHVETQVFLPSVLPNEQPEDEDMKRKSTNLEEALNELEAIYNSLRLGDEDLLERAEQREKEVVGVKPEMSWSRGALSDSSFSYEPFDSVDSPRKRFYRKSQTIDRKGDDMAYRKLHKDRSATINDPQSVLARVSYLNASALFGKSLDEVPNPNSKEPDITLDDVVFRNVKFAKNSPKILDPQPLFGIPVGPITHAANSDYLHAVPDNYPRVKPRRIPDLVKDDLAFRNLRKDPCKEPLLPDDVKNNNSNEKQRLDLNSLKKRRAVRSLSANIGSLMGKGRTLTDIADAMEIARQVLKDKEDRISKKGFLSDCENTENGNSLAESRMNFLNSLKGDGEFLSTKPPSGGASPERKSRSPREATPVPVTKDSQDSSLDDLLSALATEATETQERISNEFNRNDAFAEIDAVSEQAKLCEKLLEGVVDSSDLMVTTPKPSLEEVVQISQDPPLVESVANIILKVEKPESDHDYENLTSDTELKFEEDVLEKCTSPFEEHKAELIATFQELKKNINSDLNGKESEVSDAGNQ